MVRCVSPVQIIIFDVLLFLQRKICDYIFKEIKYNSYVRLVRNRIYVREVIKCEGIQWNNTSFLNKLNSCLITNNISPNYSS